MYYCAYIHSSGHGFSCDTVQGSSQDTIYDFCQDTGHGTSKRGSTISTSSTVVGLTMSLLKSQAAKGLNTNLDIWQFHTHKMMLLVVYLWILSQWCLSWHRWWHQILIFSGKFGHARSTRE